MMQNIEPDKMNWVSSDCNNLKLVSLNKEFLTIKSKSFKGYTSINDLNEIKQDLRNVDFFQNDY